MTRAKWLDEAYGLLGTREVPGSAANPVIMQLWQDIGLRPPPDGDETAWCAVFASSMLERAGVASPKTCRARDFLDWGTPLRQPRLGAIVVLRRGKNPALGHVGFYVGGDQATVQVLGGNQGDAVTIAGFRKADVLGYRWPAAVEAPAPAIEPPTVLGEDVSVARDVRRSWTLTGGLIAMLATLADWIESAAGVARDAIAHSGMLRPMIDWMTSLGVTFSGSAKALAVCGLLIVIGRRLQAARRAKIG